MATVNARYILNGFLDIDEDLREVEEELAYLEEQRDNLSSSYDFDKVRNKTNRISDPTSLAAIRFIEMEAELHNRRIDDIYLRNKYRSLVQRIGRDEARVLLSKYADHQSNEAVAYKYKMSVSWVKVKDKNGREKLQGIINDMSAEELKQYYR